MRCNVTLWLVLIIVTVNGKLLDSFDEFRVSSYIFGLLPFRLYVRTQHKVCFVVVVVLNRDTILVFL